MSLDFSALAALYARLQAAPDDQDFRALADAARPWQPGKASWRALLTALCGTGGVLLLVSALIFFFAWNWAALPRLTKLSLADAAFLLCCLTAATACFVRQGQGGGLWRTALFGACLCAGAWFALIGQLYQTGADVWQLFALWALFTLPLTLLSRSTATAILWLLIANLALFIAPLWSGELPAGDAYWREITARQMVFNLLMLVLLEIGGPRWLAVPRRWPQRLVVFLALLPGVAWACIDVFGEHWQKISSAWLVLSLGWLMVYHGGRYGAKRYPADLPILAIVLTGLITVATCLVGKLTISERFWREDGFGLFGFFLTGLALILMSGAATVWLTRLHVKASAHAALERETPLRTDEPEPMPAPPEPLHQALAAAPLFPPVWLTVLQGAAAWVAALLILPWLFLLVDEPAAWIVPGVLLLGAACWLLRTRKGIFAEQLGLAASLSGQGVLVGWLWLYVFDDLWRGQTPGLLLGVCAALIAAGMTWLKTPRLHRSLCAMLALGWLCLGLLNFFDTASDIWREDRRMQVVWMQFEALSTCALAVWLWLARPQSIGGKRAALAQSVAEGAAFVAVALLIVIGLVLGNEHSSFVHAQAALPGMSGWDWLYGAGAAALLALVARRVGGNRAMLAALPFLALGIWQPWLALVLCLILAAFFAAERFGLALSLIAGGLLLGNFYYVLHLSLLAKSAALAAGGVLLLAALIVARRRLGEAGPSSGWLTRKPLPGGKRRLMALVGAALVVLIPAWIGIGKNEALLVSGQTLFLPLAPVDPRSLMQGDYMALRFAADSDLRDADDFSAQKPPRYAWFQKDERGIGTLAGISDTLDAPPAPNLIVLRLRRTDAFNFFSQRPALSVGPNAFFFQEGTADAYDRARYGEFRIAADGAALLTHLADAQLQRINPPAGKEETP